MIRFKSTSAYWDSDRRSSVVPSIIPNDRLNRDFYLMLEDFRTGAAFRETDEGISYISLIDDRLTGQYGQV